MASSWRWRILIYPCNVVGYARVVAYVAALVYAERPLHAALLFGLGHVLDIVDGRLARAFGHTTRFGDYLDHVLDYVFIPISFWMVSAYGVAFQIGVAAYCAFTLLEMITFQRHYKFVSENRPMTSVLIRNNYANLWAYLFVYALMVEPLVIWAFSSELPWLHRYAEAWLWPSQFYLTAWFSVRLIEGFRPFVSTLRRRFGGE